MRTKRVVRPEVGPRGSISADCTAEARAEAVSASHPLAESKRDSAPPPDARRDAAQVQERDVHVVALHVVDCEGARWPDFLGGLRCMERCLARASTIASTRMHVQRTNPAQEEIVSLGTVAWRTLAERMPCLPSACADACSRPASKLANKEHEKVMRGDRSLRTYHAPTPLRVRARAFELSGDGKVVWIDMPLRKAATCAWALEQVVKAEEAKRKAEAKEKARKPGTDPPKVDEVYVPRCLELVPADGKTLHVRLKCIADGPSAIATMRRVLREKDGYRHLDALLFFQGGPTQKPKLMLKLAYSHPRPDKREGQAAAAVLSFSHAIYAVAADGRSFSLPAEGLIDARKAFYERQRRIKKGSRTTIGGACGHGHKRFDRRIESTRHRESAWIAAQNWNIANDLARWCADLNVNYVFGAEWTSDVSDLPKEVQPLVLRWSRADAFNKIQQVLQRNGRTFEKVVEPEVRCPICSEAPQLPWTPNRVSHCPCCGYARERDYARCVCTLDACGVDVKPVVRQREREFQAARKEAAQQEEV